MIIITRLYYNNKNNFVSLLWIYINEKKTKK